MNHLVFLALAATIGTWLVTALGAATVVFFKSPNPTALNGMLGFASGVMIAASFWSLLQPAIERAEAASGLPAYLVATVGFLFGALFMWASDKAVTFARSRADSVQGRPSQRQNRILMLVMSITLHNIPEGMAVVVPLVSGGMKKGSAVLITAASGAPTIIGALLGYWIGVVGPLGLCLSLSCASGAMLYVVLGELLPEAILMWRSKLPAFATAGGILLGLLLMYV